MIVFHFGGIRSFLIRLRQCVTEKARLSTAPARRVKLEIKKMSGKQRQLLMRGIGLDCLRKKTNGGRAEYLGAVTFVCCASRKPVLEDPHKKAPG